MEELPGWSETLINILPILAVVVTVALVARLSHWLIRYRQKKTGDSDKLPAQVITLVAVIIGIIGVILVMPINDTTRNHLFTLFGLVATAIIAFSSTTFASSVLAGFLLRARHRLRPGNFILYGGDLGRITEIGLIQTVIQTRHRNFTFLPNTALLSDKVTIINPEGTVVSAEISLGYDIHHADIEERLIAAAVQCGLEEPHVRIRELGDFSVIYRVAGLLKEARLFLTARSNLRKAILDCLHDAGIEIVSPGFMNQRPIPVDKPVIPKHLIEAGKDTPTVPEVIPEDVIFDKADEAEKFEKLKDERKQLLDRVQALKGELSELEGDRKLQKESQIEACETHIKALDTALNQPDE